MATSSSFEEELEILLRIFGIALTTIQKKSKKKSYTA